MKYNYISLEMINTLKNKKKKLVCILLLTENTASDSVKLA